MALIESAPSAVHIGADELPFVDIGDGSKLKVIQVKEREGLWIVENIFQAGYEVQKHRHTGPVWGYTTSGAWKYKEYDYVNRAGSFLYEPAGSVHTLQCIEDDTRVWFHMYGVEPQPRRRRQRRERRRRRGHRSRSYFAMLRGRGPAPPERAGRLTWPTSTSYDPDTYVDGAAARGARRAAPHAARLLPGDGGRARLLGGAEARRRRARRARAEAVLGERGRRDAREPRRPSSSR